MPNEPEKRSALAKWADEHTMKYGEHMWCVEVPKTEIRPLGYFRAYANRAEISANGDLILWGNACLLSTENNQEVPVSVSAKGQWLDVCRTDECGEPLGLVVDDCASVG